MNDSAKKVSSKHETKEILQDYLEIVWRRKWWIILPVLISIGVGAALYQVLPKSYLSSTLILVEPQKVPSDYVKPSISGTIEDRLTTIRQQILSRSLLNKIITEFGLYKKESQTLSSEEVLELMRKQIDIKTVGGRNIDAFTISFEGEDPKIVMNVTNKLASLYIEENLKVREELIEGTTDFLEAELERLKESLDKQEKLISDFKFKNRGSLPQQLDTNLRSLDRYQLELQTNTESIRLAEDKKSALENKLDEVRKSPIEIVEPQTDKIPENPNVSDLERMKKTLEIMRMDYTDSYPDVIVLKRKIKELEDSIGKQPGMEDKPKIKGTVNPNLVFSSNINKQLKDVTNELNLLIERRQEINLKIQKLEKEVEKTPTREQEMDSLVRDYGDTKNAYQALLEKKLSAKLSENLEKRQKGEQFRILDLANMPEKPSKPSIVGVFGMCLAGGFGIGFGLVFFIELFDASFKSRKKLKMN